MKKSRKEITSIITINSYSQKFYKLYGNRFERLKKLTSDKKSDIISFVSNRDLIIEAVDVSPNLPHEHIQDYITDKVYEELRLDPTILYGIYPVKTAIRGDNLKYQVLIADKNQLKENLAPIAKKVKYIDYVIPEPLLFKTLYKNNRLNSNSTDMFVYLGEFDSFIAFYHKGEYLYSKSIDYSLNEMYDKFCKLAQDVPISKEQFREILANNGLKTADESYRGYLVKVINDCFLKINDVFIFTKRNYDLQNMKNVYIGMGLGYIDGIESYSQNYLSLESKPISSIYSNEDPKTTIDPIHALMVMTAKDLKKGVLDLPNLTPYPKPESLAKRPAGKIIFSIFIVTLLFLLPVIYDYVTGLTLQGKNVLLRKTERRVTAEANMYKKKLKERREKLKALDKAIGKLRKEYEHRKGELTNVYNKKFKYKMKSEQLALITEVIKKYDIKSRNIEITDNEYKIEVESKSDKEITAFIEDLVKRFGSSIENIDIKKITYDKKEKLYKGVLKVSFTEGE